MKTKPMKMIMMTGALLVALLFVDSCSKDDPAVVINKTALTAGITAANGVLDAATEGSAAGQFPNGSKATLQAAIDAAQDIADSPTATQAQVTAVVASLAAAVSDFQALAVVAIDPTNLVGHWTFDEVGTPALDAVVKDYSGNTRNGAVKTGHVYWGAGTPTAAADRYGMAGKALHFDDGANVEVPYNVALNPTNMSISLWLKQDVQSPSIYADQYMVSMNRWNGFKFQMQGDPKAFFTTTHDSPPVCCYDRDNASPILTQGQWWHVVVTFGGGHNVFYVNGVMVKDWDNTPGTISTLANPVNLTIGVDIPTSKAVAAPDSDPFYVNYGGHFVGALDEVRMYKSILSASQVTSIYNLEKP